MRFGKVTKEVRFESQEKSSEKLSAIASGLSQLRLGVEPFNRNTISASGQLRFERVQQ